MSQETIDSDEYTGKTEASETVEIRARVFGYLKSIEFKDGDFVTEGRIAAEKQGNIASWALRFFSGTLGVTLFGIFLTPVFYYVIVRPFGQPTSAASHLPQQPVILHQTSPAPGVEFVRAATLEPK